MVECVRETEVFECAMSGRPAGALQEHIGTCASCRDLFESARAVMLDRAALVRDARPASAGSAWWRIKMREHRELQQTAIQAGTLVQVMLLAIALTAAISILGLHVDLHAIGTAATSFLGGLALPMLAVIAWVVLAPIALYLAFTDR